MTLSRTALCAVLPGESDSVAHDVRLLWPLALAGVLSVLYRWFGERLGHGDLRPYVLVQFLPMAVMPGLLQGWPARLTGSGWYGLVLAAYVATKLAELGAARLYTLTGSVSGHSRKHLLASGRRHAVSLYVA